MPAVGSVRHSMRVDSSIQYSGIRSAAKPIGIVVEEVGRTVDELIIFSLPVFDFFNRSVSLAAEAKAAADCNAESGNTEQKPLIFADGVLLWLTFYHLEYYCWRLF